METTDKRVIACIAMLLGMMATEIADDADLENGLGMDSLDKIELVMALETEFGVEIADEEAEACNTVADVVALVERVTA